MMPLIDLTGQRFGALLVLERGEDYISPCGRKQPGFICQCDCGATVRVRSQDLRRGTTNSCGSNYHSRLTDDEALRGYYWTKLQNRAKKYQREVTLTPDQLLELAKQPCHYCGTPPENYTNHSGRHIVYQGIDRIDSSKGYTPENCLPCCAMCNSIKGDRPYLDYMRG